MSAEREDRFLSLLEEDQNDPAIQYEIGLCYLQGDGAAQSGQEADKWLRRAAEQGHEEARALLESSGEEKKSGALTEETLPEWCMRAEDGNAEAQYQVARYFFNHYNLKDCLPDVERYLQGAVEQGHPAACLALARIRLKQPSRMMEAEELLRNAADCGLAEASELLGKCYATGKGAPLNPEEAERRFIQAAQMGSGERMLSLAVRYATGDMVPASPGRALNWLKRAQDAGCPDAEAHYRAICKEQGEKREAERQRLEKKHREEAERLQREEALQQQKTAILAQQEAERRKVAEKVHMAALRDREKAAQTSGGPAAGDPGEQEEICLEAAEERRQQSEAEREEIRRIAEEGQRRRMMEYQRQREAAAQQSAVQEAERQREQQRQQAIQPRKDRLLRLKNAVCGRLISEAKGAWHVLLGITSTFWGLVLVVFLLALGCFLVYMVLDLYANNHPILATGLLLITIRSAWWLIKKD